MAAIDVTHFTDPGCPFAYCAAPVAIGDGTLWLDAGSPFAEAAQRAAAPALRAR